MLYNKTVWIDNKTCVDAAKLNKIESAIERLSKLGLTTDKLKTICGKSIVGGGNLDLPDLYEVLSEVDILELLGFLPARYDQLPQWEEYDDEGNLIVKKDIKEIGYGIVTDHSEYAIGVFNKSMPNTIFSIGSGTGPDDRRNSIQIRDDGQVYILGVGGFDGTNSDDPSVRTISEVIAPTTGMDESWVGIIDGCKSCCEQEDSEPEKVVVIKNIDENKNDIIDENKNDNISYFWFDNIEDLLNKPNVIFPDIPSNQIWYKSNSGEKINPCGSCYRLVSNKLIGNYYIMEFSEDLVCINDATSYNSGLFRNSKDLVRIRLPKTLKYIGSRCFQGCTGLNYIVFPKNIEGIGKFAFSGCTGLELMRFDSMTPPEIDKTSFSGVSKSIPIFIPKGSDYSGFADFNNFIEYE